MKRAILILFIALGLAGCKSQTPTVDPFFGRTTIPPPSTGSIAGQAADPYYRSTPPVQSPSLQVNTPYNQGRTLTNPTNPTNPPLYSGPSWTNPSNPPSGSTLTNQYNAPQYRGPASSVLTGPSPAGVPGTSTYPLQPAPQYNPVPGTPPAGYTPQTPSAQPASMPSTPPGSTWPGVNRYTPPGGTYNYRGTSSELPNPQPTSPSPNRVATPFFTGGTPNRSTITATNNGAEPPDYAMGNLAGTNPNINSYQNVSNPQATYTPAGIAGGPSSSSAGQSPIVRTLQPQPRDRPQGNNYLLPASQRYAAPTPAQPANNSPQPTWRESSSSDTRIIDDNVEAVSNTESKEANE